MSRPTVVRAVVAVVVLLVSAFLVLTGSPRLGLDLQGGTRLVVETRSTSTTKADADTTDRTMEVLRHRVDALGVAEPTLTRSGENRIVVELPDVQDPREAVKVLGRTAQLTFHPVEGPGSPKDAEDKSAEAGKDGKDGGGEEPDERRDQSRAGSFLDESGRMLKLGKAEMTGSTVKEAEAQIDQQGAAGWFVGLDFHGGGKDWAALTGKAACHPPGDDRRRVAIVLDQEVISSPQVDPGVRCGSGISGGSTQITGSFGQQEAKELALLIKGGALPVPVDLVEQRTVGPTLGADAIEASAKAAVIGVVLTSLFVIVIYRFFGALAALALAAYGLISYAALLALGVTLTLPGLAGFVLAIGMAVDANVLVFERAREEYAAGTGGRRNKRTKRSLRTAVTAGFRNAFSAIADSNITTLIAAGLLFFLASGPVKGFGVTLAIGVLASMVSALVIARALAEIASERDALVRRPRLNGIAFPGRVRTWLTKRKPDVLRRTRLLLTVSAVVVIVAGSGVVLRGLEWGVEFTGGRLTEYATAQPVDVEAARSALADAGFDDAEVTTSGDSDLSVRMADLSNEDEAKVRAALAEEGGEVTKLNDELIGPSLGDELRRNALIALGVAVLAQLAYLAFRFRWTFGAGSVVAMTHDVVVLLGVFAWLGKPIDGIFLASLLTVIGYSVNDSVVVFDRVRELWGAARRSPFPEVANTAVLQTVPRTVNTGMGAIFILGTLLVLGGDSLADFALALLIGIVVGTYSSVFTAVPLAIELEAARRNAPPPRPVSRTSGAAKDRTAAHKALDDNGARV
ncbi:protein translocase subunit SecD [Streptomyces sp. P38-E01]|uniref:Multifunctional fusion protein n=1 Tax=Streptomyces tardus TaxID=2780544 RepID=A0A949JP80_9ACTN|nr:protein translocase subunit SecD [Streptomyces tardus]MBU7597745.1 protein translocase subunit SecD [Streptomyces tardus]